MAKLMLQIAFPDHEILTVDCRALIRQHGSLHCATMQFPKEWIVE
jgi:agmatine/peptidylarginine deiminase